MMIAMRSVGGAYHKRVRNLKSMRTYSLAGFHEMAKPSPKSPVSRYGDVLVV